MYWLIRISSTRLTPSINRFQSLVTRRSCSFFQCFENSETESWPSMEGLVQCSANCVPLSPISFLERSSRVYRDRVSIVYGSLRYTWRETHERCLKLASALTQLGVSRGDVVRNMFIFSSLSPACLKILHFMVFMQLN